MRYTLTTTASIIAASAIANIPWSSCEASRHVAAQHILRGGGPDTTAAIKDPTTTNASFSHLSHAPPNWRGGGAPPGRRLTFAAPAASPIPPSPPPTPCNHP